MEEARAYLAKMKSSEATPNFEEGREIRRRPGADLCRREIRTRMSATCSTSGRRNRTSPRRSWSSSTAAASSPATNPRRAVTRSCQQCLDAGVSFAAINYRYRTTAPIQDVLHDCARAIQFIRSKAGEWNVDKTRIASYGGSAGAGTSLWLAFHDDLADPNNADPVLRESSRLVCAGANSCQFSYDIMEWPKVFGEEVCKRFGEPDDNWPGFYGLKTDEELNGPPDRKFATTATCAVWFPRMIRPSSSTAAQHGGEVTDRGNYLHHPKHAEAVKKRCDEIGVECVAVDSRLGHQTARGQAAESCRISCSSTLGSKRGCAAQ